MAVDAGTIRYTINNASILLNVIQTVTFEERAATDEAGNHTLVETYGKWKTLFNPQTVSYKASAPATGGQPVQEFGHFPQETEQALIFWLSQPRGKVTWTMPSNAPGGTTVLFQSPATGKTVDARNGPRPHVVAIEKVFGSKSYAITWELTTWKSYADKVKTNPPILLSHTFQTTEEIDEQFYTTRTTEGRAVFNRALLPANITPDDFRSYVLPIAPRHFKRTVRVTATSDGTQLAYICVDREQRLTLGSEGIVRVEAQLTGDVAIPSIINQISSTVQAVAGAASIMAAGVGGAAAGIAGGASAASNVGQLGKGATGSAISFSQSIQASLPTASFTSRVRVWGSKITTIARLESFAYLVASTRINQVIGPGNFYSTIGTHTLFDFAEGMVEVALNRQTVCSGFIANWLIGGVSADVAVRTALSQGRDDNVHTPNAQYFPPNPNGSPIEAALLSERGGMIPPLGLFDTINRSSTCRGYIIGKIFSQALAGFAEAPKGPQLPVLPVLQSNPNTV